jgi:hypothetical protein
MRQVVRDIVVPGILLGVIVLVALFARGMEGAENVAAPLPAPPPPSVPNS